MLYSNNQIYLIDFGLAKYFEDENGVHISFKDGKRLSGTARYACLNTHLGFEQTRRNDLGAIGHCLVYLLKGGLPW